MKTIDNNFKNLDIGISKLVDKVDFTKSLFPKIEPFKPEILGEPMVKKLERIEAKQDQILDLIKIIWTDLDKVYNNMGRISQRATRENLEIRELIGEYIELLKDQQPDRNSKVEEFFKSLPMEIALTVIVEVGKKALGLQ